MIVGLENLTVSVDATSTPTAIRCASRVSEDGSDSAVRRNWSGTRICSSYRMRTLLGHNGGPCQCVEDDRELRHGQKGATVRLDGAGDVCGVDQEIGNSWLEFVENVEDFVLQPSIRLLVDVYLQRRVHIQGPKALHNVIWS